MNTPTDELFRQDAYLRECVAQVLRIEVTADGQPMGVILDRTVFYPLGGGQAGDAGWLHLPGGETLAIADTRKAKGADGSPTGEVLHVFSSEIAPLSRNSLHSLLSNLQSTQTQIRAEVDWHRRHRLMRFHTTTHLLCHLVGELVDGCSITPDYARLDFHMTAPLDKEALTAGIAKLVAADHAIHISTVTDAELDANPALVKSMSVQPPRGSGLVRTIRIATDTELIDLQPCGGTHVARTGEIGQVIVTKIEKKSANTRRVVLGFGGELGSK